MPVIETYSTLLPQPTDTQRILIAKITKSVTVTTIVSGGAGVVGHGSPQGVVTAPPGTTYGDLDTGDFGYKFTGVGNTGWLALIGGPWAIMFLCCLFSLSGFAQNPIQRNYYTTNANPSSPSATNITVYNNLTVNSNLTVQNVTITNSLTVQSNVTVNNNLTVKGKSTVNIQVTSNLYAVPITNKVLYSDSTGLVSGIPNANGVLTNNGTAFGFGPIPALGGIDITGTNGVIITTNGALRIAGLDPSIASALTNVSTNWVIYSTNIYVNNSYVSNYFVTNVFNNTFMSNYYNTNLYTFVTNQYTTNVSVTNTFTTFNNSYVSNFYQTNIFQDTFNSNYFYTNLFVTTNVFITNLYVNTGVWTNDNNNVYPVVASVASLWFLPGGAARGTNTIDLLAKRTSINNVAAATGSTLVGGLDNGVALGSDYGIVAGGVLNFIDGSSTFDAIVGGSNNEINNGVSSSFIGGGDHNLLYGPRSAIISGGANAIYGDPANLIAASTDSTIGTNSGYASIIAGDSSTINGAVGSDYFSILGGLQNHIVSPSSGFGFILGGRQNAISANHAWTIGDFLTNATASSIDLGFSQSAKVRVDAANLNLIGTMALKQTNGAGAGLVMTSDASGVGSWVALSIPAQVWTNDGNFVRPTFIVESNNIGIGNIAGLTPGASLVQVLATNNTSAMSLGVDVTGFPASSASTLQAILQGTPTDNRHHSAIFSHNLVPGASSGGLYFGNDTASAVYGQADGGTGDTNGACGLNGYATGRAGLLVGVVGEADPSASGSTNVGIVGNVITDAAGTLVGGFFEISDGGADPIIEPAVLLLDHRFGTNDLLIARTNNGATVAKLTASGIFSANGYTDASLTSGQLVAAMGTPPRLVSTNSVPGSIITGTLTNTVNSPGTNGFSSFWLTNGVTTEIHAWSGPTNDVDLLLSRQQYTTITNMAITNFLNVPAIGFERSVVLTVTNSIGNDLTLTITAGGVTSDDGLRVWTVTNKTQRAFSIRVADTGTNVITRTFY